MKITKYSFTENGEVVTEIDFSCVTDKTKLEKYGFTEDDEVTENDIFLIEHHEKLFYLNPLELAMAINAMKEDELLRFNENTRFGYGRNAELMREKLDELEKYMYVNMPIFGEAYLRSVINDHDLFLLLKEIIKSGRGLTSFNFMPNKELTDWQKELAKRGILFNDGKRVIKSLDNAVREYVRFTGNETTWRFVKENFLKPNYSEYGEETCKKAVSYSNIQ